MASDRGTCVPLCATADTAVVETRVPPPRASCPSRGRFVRFSRPPGRQRHAPNALILHRPAAQRAEQQSGRAHRADALTEAASRRASRGCAQWKEKSFLCFVSVHGWLRRPPVTKGRYRSLHAARDGNTQRGSGTRARTAASALARRCCGMHAGLNTLAVKGKNCVTKVRKQCQGAPRACTDRMSVRFPSSSRMHEGYRVDHPRGGPSECRTVSCVVQATERRTHGREAVASCLMSHPGACVRARACRSAGPVAHKERGSSKT